MPIAPTPEDPEVDPRPDPPPPISGKIMIRVGYVFAVPDQPEQRRRKHECGKILQLKTDIR